MSAAAPDAPGRRRVALIAAPASAVVLYLVCVTALMATLGWAFGGLSRERFAGAAMLWATYLLPALVAPAAGALFNALFLGESGRRAAYWPNLALVAGFTAVAVLWLLLAGGTWNTILAFVQFGCGLVAWYLLHRAARGRAERR